MHDERDKDDKDELHHEALQERSQIARYLRAIADGVEGGRLTLSSGVDELTLNPPYLCSFELRAKEERNRSKLRLRLAWRKSDEAKPETQLKVES